MTQSVLSADLSQVRWLRLRRTGLIDPFVTPEHVAQELAGVQAQIHPAAGLALAARTHSLDLAGYDARLFADRTLVKLWGQRGTLHVYPMTEWPLVCAMLAERKSWWGRTAERTDRYADYAALVRQAEALLRAKGVMGRSDLRASGLITDAEHLSPWGGIFADLVRAGHACHAARDGEGIFAHRAYWRPDLAWAPPDPEQANRTLLRRYLHTYGPATLQDYAYWHGGPRASARRWWESLTDELATVSIDGVEMSLLRTDIDELLAPADELRGTVRLLYRFDPLLLAHKDKRWIVPAAQHKQVFRIAGHIEGVVIDGGLAVATWRYQRKSSGLIITLEPFTRLAVRVRRAIENEARRVAAFFRLPLAGIVGEG